MSESLCIDLSDVTQSAESSPLTRYLSQVLPHLPDMMAVHAPDGAYRLVSPQLRQITGRSPAQVLGRSPYEWIHPEDLQLVQKRYHEAMLRGASVHGRYRMRHEDGHYIWLEFVGVPMFQDPKNPKAISAIVTLAKDITPLVEAEQSASIRMKHLGLMEELAHLAWFTFDFETGAVQHNEAFVELTGRAASAFNERNDWRSLIEPADRHRFRDAMATLWRLPAGETRTIELRIAPPGYPSRWVRLTLSLMEVRPAGNRQLFGVVLDIDELVRSREQTQRWVRQRERVGLRERQDIAHELHDEVGQILTGMRWQLEALQRRTRAGHWPQTPDELPLDSWLSSIDEAHNTLRAIAHRLRPPLAAIGLRAAIQKLAEEYAGLWLGSTRLTLELADHLPDGDEWRVNVVLGILRESLNNVARHANAAHVWVKATLPMPGLFRLVVRDDGIGMDLQKAQLGNTLGLTSLQERARLIDARLLIDSCPGHGTCVTLEFWINESTDNHDHG